MPSSVVRVGARRNSPARKNPGSKHDQTLWSPSHTAEQVNLSQVPPPQGTNYFTPRGVKILSSDNESLNLSGLTTSYSS